MLSHICSLDMAESKYLPFRPFTISRISRGGIINLSKNNNFLALNLSRNVGKNCLRTPRCPCAARFLVVTASSISAHQEPGDSENTSSFENIDPVGAQRIQTNEIKNGNEDKADWSYPIHLDAAVSKNQAFQKFMIRLLVATAVSVGVGIATYVRYKPGKILEILPVPAMQQKDIRKEEVDNLDKNVDISPEESHSDTDSTPDSASSSIKEERGSESESLLSKESEGKGAQVPLEEEQNFDLDTLVAAMTGVAVANLPSEKIDIESKDVDDFQAGNEIEESAIVLLSKEGTKAVLTSSDTDQVKSVLSATAASASAIVPSASANPAVSAASTILAEPRPGPSPPAPLFAPAVLTGRGTNAANGVIGRVIVAPKLDPSHVQLFQALQAVKLIEEDVSPSSICTRRQYARWLLLSTNILSRDMGARIFPAMYVDGLTQLAFDDVSPQDPDFPAIQGLAECGLIASQLSQTDLKCDRSKSSRSGSSAGCMEGVDGKIKFRPDSALSRQDLISWRVALSLHSTLSPIQSSKAADGLVSNLKGPTLNFLDRDSIDTTALPAIAKDLEAGQESIIASAFGFTRRFEPAKPVTCVQAAISLSVGEHSEALSEELSRLEAEQIAEAAIQAVAEEEVELFRVQIQNIEGEKEVMRLEREVIEKAALETQQKLDKVLQDREKEWEAIQSTKMAIEAERRLLQHLRHESEILVTELGRERERVETKNGKKQIEIPTDQEKNAEVAAIPALEVSSEPSPPSKVEPFVVVVAIEDPLDNEKVPKEELAEGKDWRDAVREEMKSLASNVSRQISKLSQVNISPVMEIPKAGVENLSHVVKKGVENVDQATQVFKDGFKNVQEASSAGKAKVLEAFTKLKESAQTAASSLKK